jgi:hypothetical protein
MKSSDSIRQHWLRAMMFYKLELGRGRYHILIPRSRFEIGAVKNTWPLAVFLPFILILDLVIIIFFVLYFPRALESTPKDYSPIIVFFFLFLFFGSLTRGLLKATWVLWKMATRQELRPPYPKAIDIKITSD